MPQRRQIAPGAYLSVLEADKFCRQRVSIHFIWPAVRERATAEALLGLVMERGYAGCPDMTELSKKLAGLYGAALSVDGSVSGGNRVLTVSVTGIQDRFALAGEVLHGARLSAMRVAGALLGGTATSRLFQYVREKMSLCYYCSAGYTASTGMLCVDSGVEHANCEAAQQAILAELDKLCAGPIEPRELDETKRALKNALISVGDSLQAAENWYLGCLLRGADETPAQVIEEVQAVTADDVRSVLGAFRLSVAYRITKGGDGA